MPRYDVRCRACGATFEISRPMVQADDPAPCPQGHTDTVRLLPTVGVTGRATASRAATGGGCGDGAGGGCCGGGGCGAG